MQEPSILVVNQFIIDCGELARELDSVGVRDGRDAIHSTLAKCRIDYLKLLQKRDEMFMTPCELPIIQMMLDGLLARLSFLERAENRRHKNARLWD
jgi:hypothetical protein